MSQISHFLQNASATLRSVNSNFDTLGLHPVCLSIWLAGRLAGMLAVWANWASRLSGQAWQAPGLTGHPVGLLGGDATTPVTPGNYLGVVFGIVHGATFLACQDTRAFEYMNSSHGFLGC